MRSFILLGLLFFSINGYSQSLISGKVSNSENGDPVSFVNIIITELGKGTVSNIDGEFNFRLPASGKDEMEVVFSHIGFESTSFQVRDLKKAPIEVKLIPSEYDLDQAIVLDYHPKKIMERAQENLVQTQYGSPHEIEVFYRELIWANDIIQGFTRSRGDMHSEGYQKKHSKRPNTSGDIYNFLAFDQIQKTNYGVITRFNGMPRGAISDMLFPFMIFRLWDFNINWFDYELLGGKKIGDREVFVLAIKAKNNGVKNRANRWGHSLYGLLESAVFYIDQADYGIHMMELRQTYPEDKITSEYYGQVFLPESRDGVVKFKRDKNGKYFFTYANYSKSYVDYGYEAEESPLTRNIKEYSEIYAVDISLQVLTNAELSAKYRGPVSGTNPNRTFYFHPDLYNGWIFISGKARYNSDFWAGYDYPSYPGEVELESKLASVKPLAEQFSEFRNNQFYLFPILRKRNGLRENFWDRTGLFQVPKSEY